MIGQEMYNILLFIAGEGPNSRQAKANLDRICDVYLKDHCRPEVIDVFQDFETALEYNVLVTPTLVMLSPRRTRIVGNLNDMEKVLSALGVAANE